jgi:hypothetical protein
MTEKEKIKYFSDRVSYWRKFLLIDPKITVFVSFNRNTSQGHEYYYDDANQELLRHEELLVTGLEQALIGEKECQKIINYVRNDTYTAGGPWGDCDVNQGMYWVYSINIYERALRYDGAAFKCIANSIACHEVCHILVWPAFSYAGSLKDYTKEKRP